MEWNTLIAVGGTLIGALLGAGVSIWLGRTQHKNDSKKWEKDNKLVEYVRVVTGFGELFNLTFDYLYLSRATRTDVHDTFNKIHRTTMMLLAPSEVLVKYNTMYELFSQYIGTMQEKPTQANQNEWSQFNASYRVIRRELAQEMRKDLDLAELSFKGFDSIDSRDSGN